MKNAVLPFCENTIIDEISALSVQLPFQDPQNIHVIRLDKDKFKLADHYIKQHPKASLFHQTCFSHFIENIYGHRSYILAAFDHNQNIVGVLPLNYIKSSLFGNSLISTAFFVRGGILADSLSIAKILAHYACLMAKGMEVDYVELRHEQALKLPDWQVKDNIYAYFSVPLIEDEEKSLQNIPRKKRADLRKAMKNNKLSYIFSRNIDDFYKCYSHNLQNLGTPVHHKSYYKELMEMLGDRCEILTLYYEGYAVASLMSFYDNQTVFPYFGGALECAKRLHVYDYMYWLMMRRAVTKGYSIFDFGRSRIGSGAYHYKKNFGFEPKKLEYQYYLSAIQEMPNINPDNPSHAWKVKLWKKMPVFLCNAMGNIIAKQLA